MQTFSSHSLVTSEDVLQMRDPLQDDDVEVGVETPVLVQQGEADGVTEAERIVQYFKFVLFRKVFRTSECCSIK